MGDSGSDGVRMHASEQVAGRHRSIVLWCGIAPNCCRPPGPVARACPPRHCRAYSVLLSMPTTKYYARIAITLPKKDLAAADRLARTQDRSRSWIVAEAIRRYAAVTEVQPVHVADTVGSADAAAAASPPLSHSGLGASRLAQLTSDLQLTPEARVLAAEETLRQTGLPRRPRRHQLLAFDRYEDFLDWKKTRDAR